MPIVRAGEVPRVSPTACLFEGEEHGVRVSAFLVDSTPGLGASLHAHPYAEGAAPDDEHQPAGRTATTWLEDEDDSERIGS